jgi:hypothetical protein
MNRIKELARAIDKDPNHVRKCRDARQAMTEAGAPPHEFQRYHRMAGQGTRAPAEGRRSGGGPKSSPEDR